MARRNVKITRSGSAIIVKIDGYTENIDCTYITRADAYERIRWAAITAGASLNNETVIEILREVYDVEKDWR